MRTVARTIPDFEVVLCKIKSVGGKVKGFREIYSLVRCLSKPSLLARQLGDKTTARNPITCLSSQSIRSGREPGVTEAKAFVRAVKQIQQSTLA